MSIRNHLHCLTKVIICINPLKYTVGGQHIFIIILWLHHLTFSGAFSLTFGKKKMVQISFQII